MVLTQNPAVYLQFDDVRVPEQTEVLNLHGRVLIRQLRVHTASVPRARLTSRCTLFDISGVDILRFEMNFMATLSPVAVCLATVVRA